MANTVTTDEKYVSIEYSTWEKKYKPMEETNNQLRKELQEEKEKHEITVNLSFYEHHCRNYFRIGYIDAKTGFFKGDRDVDIMIIKTMKKLLSSWGQNEPKKVLVTYEEFEQNQKAIRTLEHQKEELLYSQRNIREQMDELEKERQALRKERAALVLPRFLSRLFNIKKRHV